LNSGGKNYFYIMTPFTYLYKGRTYESAVDMYWDGENHRYRVIVDVLYYELIIFQMGRSNNQIIWLQCMGPGIMEQPHDLIQAIGEGIEKTAVPIR